MQDAVINEYKKKKIKCEDSTPTTAKKKSSRDEVIIALDFPVL